MGTKSNPGKYDCYAKAKPDEELFTLLERDEHMPHLVRYWAWLKAGNAPRFHEAANMDDLRQNARTNPKLQEALDCADRAQQQRILKIRMKGANAYE